MMKILVPAYFAWWTEQGVKDYARLVDAARALPAGVLVVVVNPNSGPGRPDWSFYPKVREFVQNIVDAGQIALGYVSTSYGGIPIDDVVTDIKGYKHVKGLGGVFFDEASTDPKEQETLKQYVDACEDHVGKFSCLNFGTWSASVRAAAKFATCVVVRETDANSYLRHPSVEYGPKSCAILHSTPRLDIVLPKMERERIEYCYATHPEFSKGQHVWGALPPYWDQLVQRALDLQNKPEPVPVAKLAQSLRTAIGSLNKVLAALE